jgi:hypothetical protein
MSADVLKTSYINGQINGGPANGPLLKGTNPINAAATPMGCARGKKVWACGHRTSFITLSGTWLCSEASRGSTNDAGRLLLFLRRWSTTMLKAADRRSAWSADADLGDSSHEVRCSDPFVLPCVEQTGKREGFSADSDHIREVDVLRN